MSPRRGRTEPLRTRGLWDVPSHRIGIAGPDRALSLAMCRAMRDDWDLDTAAQRILDLDVGEPAMERAVATARRMHRREQTTVTARAELSLAQALVTIRVRRGAGPSALSSAATPR